MNLRCIAKNLSAPRRRSRTALLRRAIAALGLSLWLAACGPGTGGTGVGPQLGTYVLGSGSGPVEPGRPFEAHYIAEFGDGFVSLRGACFEFVYAGPWEVDAEGVLRVQGEARGVATGGDIDGAAFQRAVLTARPGDEGLHVTVQDLDGTLLLSISPLLPLPAGAMAAVEQDCGLPP